MPEHRLYSLKDVAAKLEVHPATVVRWLETGKVGLKKKKNVRGHYVFDGQDLRKLEKFKGAIRTVA